VGRASGLQVTLGQPFRVLNLRGIGPGALTLVEAAPEKREPVHLFSCDIGACWNRRHLLLKPVQNIRVADEMEAMLMSDN
jgi:hypothetical protein